MNSIPPNTNIVPSRPIVKETPVAPSWREATTTGEYLRKNALVARHNAGEKLAKFKQTPKQTLLDGLGTVATESIRFAKDPQRTIPAAMIMDMIRTLL